MAEFADIAKDSTQMSKMALSTSSKSLEEARKAFGINEEDLLLDVVGLGNQVVELLARSEFSESDLQMEGVREKCSEFPKVSVNMANNLAAQQLVGSEIHGFHTLQGTYFTVD
ncbi:hypothetical protein JHK85_046897 [Glycine max]|nr:hypothetical protein JHK85_046897 [Glycine max]